jgi:hypothetical protein
MPRKISKPRTQRSKFADFRVSNRPVIRPRDERERGVREFHDVLEVARIHGASALFAIARDPRTVFAYWKVDWLSIFAKTEPVDRQVHLRVHRADGVEEQSVAVEPMVGNCYITVSRPGGSYHIELGYYQPADIWNSVATSDEVMVPPDDFAEAADVDLATIPLHLSFQHLVDLLRPANDRELAVVISQFQKRALSSEQSKELTAGDKKVLRELAISRRQIAAAWRQFDRTDAQKLMKLTGAQPALGATSPAHAFQNDWSSGGS